MPAAEDQIRMIDTFREEADDTANDMSSTPQIVGDDTELATDFFTNE